MGRPTRPFLRLDEESLYRRSRREVRWTSWRLQGALDYDEDEAARRWKQVTPDVKQALLPFRRNFGHPHFGPMVRTLRLGGATKCAFEAAKRMPCDQCCQRPPKVPPAPAGVLRATQFGRAVQRDEWT